VRNRLLVLFIFVFTLNAYALVSETKQKDYYLEARGAKGEALFYKLQKIISENHLHRGYGELYKKLADAFANSEGVILDYYSTNPNGQNPYEYTAKDKCGTYKGEGDCFNREHLFPQSIFNKKMPMKADYHHIVPTDGYVNNRRGHLPFGEVGSVKWESMNGSKLGSSELKAYVGSVFEPRDEFKGDIARALFYFAVRYEAMGKHWNDITLDTSRYLFYKDWYIAMLKRWHKEDPVNAAELVRNDEGQKFQKNRNPFIDHPEWIEEIW
jgi:endonuclease I